MLQRTSNARPRGFTLIETVLILAVGLGLIVGSITFFKQSRFVDKTYHFTKIVTNIAIGIQAGFRYAPDFRDVSNRTAIDLGLIPDSSHDGPAIFHPFGGEISIYSASPFKTFTIAIDGLEGSACNRLFINNGGELKVVDTEHAYVTINGHRYAPGVVRNPTACLADAVNFIEIEIG
ncbi:hypothetical protein [Defluviimonas salinarum]|uniref:Prepilin-type N-terminal cleavage/methylation domain-containing protein n=1 Tax=Defluviimonas salinarum TaxID=2992147 RepID=A0ABT3J4G6_9RHOB|nr:hypothetical protein [Defluviimonas salinarum]MCW3782577.1 hypothetical protein [Defluviimonas salinarum]